MQEAAAKSSSGDDDDSPSAGSAGDSAPKKRPGRQPFPRHLQRERIVHDLKEEKKPCESCQQDLWLIGEETSERYEYVPAQVTVIEDLCKKYVCACMVKNGHQAAAADREEHGGSQSGGTGDRR